jgi:protein SCO1/2
MNRSTKNLGAVWLISMAMAFLVTPRAWAEEGDTNAVPQTPDEIKNVGITEHPNGQVPLDLVFLNERSERVTLGKYFDGSKPVVLQLGYLNCPKLCDVISRSFVDSARQIDLKAGSGFQFVFVSIDPLETPDLAALKKRGYLEEYQRADAADGFHFLIGTRQNISALADAVGYRYNTVADGQLAVPQFAHPAVLMILSPQGRITRYMYGVNYPPNTVELSLVEASAGKVGTSVDQLALLICSFDVVTGRYAMVAIKVMRLAGALTVIVMAGVLTWLFNYERRRRRNNEIVEVSK